MNTFLRENLHELRPYDTDTPTYRYKMNANECPWDIPKHLRKILVEELINGFEFNRYPDSDARDLGKTIADYCKVSPKNVVVGSGSDELIQIIINAFIDQDDAVIFPAPSFGMYRTFTIIGGGIPVAIPLGSEYSFDLSSFSSAGEKNKAKLAILCSPNNPTGNKPEEKSLERFISSFPGVVVIDEAYGEFSNRSAIELINKYPNLIVLRTLSKAFGLASLRIGYSLCNEDLAVQIKTVKPPYNINSFSQRAGILVLENSDIIRKRINQIKEQREFIYNSLMTLDGVKVYPSEANFLLFKVESGDMVFRKLLDRGILLRNFSGDQYLKNSLRVTIADEFSNINFLRALKDILNGEEYK